MKVEIKKRNKIVVIAFVIFFVLIIGSSVYKYTHVVGQMQGLSKMF